MLPITFQPVYDSQLIR